MKSKQLTMMKVCIHCGGDPKSLTDFYKNPNSTGGYAPYCKVCAGKVRKKNQHNPVRSRAVAGRPGEAILITEMRRRGIYAAPGKASEWTWIDVIAWGCVRVEVKHSLSHKGRFNFRFTLRQQTIGFKADILALICDDGTTQTFHLFDQSHPVVAHGISTRSLSFTPDAKHRKGGSRQSTLTPDNMREAQDQFWMIESYRAKWQQLFSMPALPNTG